MRCRTVDEMSEFLREDLGWRRKETRVLQAMVHSCEAAKRQALLRGAIAALYAHWEGFVKTACNVYLEFVRHRRLNNNELSVAFLSLALRSKLESLQSNNLLNSHLAFTD